LQKKKDKNSDPSAAADPDAPPPPPTKPQKKPKQASGPRPPQDALAIRTVMISGLPADVTKQVLWKKVRKVPGAEDVELVEGDATSGLHPPLSKRCIHDLIRISAQLVHFSTRLQMLLPL
jgi:hypothetical protein